MVRKENLLPNYILQTLSFVAVGFFMPFFRSSFGTSLPPFVNIVLFGILHLKGEILLKKCGWVFF